MNIRMVARRAGAMAHGMVHQALVKGSINHPRPSHVGLNWAGTISLGVWTPDQASMPVIEQMVMKTPKSLMDFLT